jgi:hypothetical protein
MTLRSVGARLRETTRDQCGEAGPASAPSEPLKRLGAACAEEPRADIEGRSVAGSLALLGRGPMVSRRIVLLAFLVLCLFVATLYLVPDVGSAAPLVTLDFEDVRTVNTNADNIVGQVYIHDGVRLTALPASPPDDPAARFAYAGCLTLPRSWV